MTQLIDDLRTIQTARDNMKLALQSKGQVVTTDIRTYANAISNISTGGGGGGTGDVKLYDSIANMRLDTNVNNGQLAIVYYNNIQGITATTQFQKCTFPQTVVLPTPVGEDDYISLSFQPLDTSIMFECWGTCERNGFYLDVMLDDGDISIYYTSTDGVNYTRNRLQKNGNNIDGDEMDFGTIIKFSDSSWDNRIGCFMQQGSIGFDGLYQYENNVYNLAKTQFTAKNINVYEDKFYGKDGSGEGSLQVVENLSAEDIVAKSLIYDRLSKLAPSTNIVNMVNLFYYYKGVNIPSIETSNVTDMGMMFYRGFNLKSVGYMNTSKVTNMYQAFYQCYNLTSIHPFDANNVTAMYQMFDSCNNLSNNSYANIANSLPMAANIEFPLVTNLGLNYNRFTPEQADILANKGYLDVKSFPNEWSNAYKYWRNGGTDPYILNKGVDYDRFGNMLRGKSDIKYDTKLVISDDGPNGSLLSMSAMFSGFNKLTDIDLSNAKTENVVTLSTMFYNCNNLLNVVNFNTSRVTSIELMFWNCKNIVEVPNWDMSNLKSMYGAFQYCNNIRVIPDWNTPNLTNVCDAFLNCYNLVNAPNLNTSKVTNMSHMFFWARSLVNVPNYNTANVTRMTWTFLGCSNLVNVPNFDTSNVNLIAGMFKGCNNLSSVPDFNTAKVTDFQEMLRECSNLTTVPNFNTANATSMVSMLFNCENLTTVPNFNTINVTNMGSMLAGCKSLTTVPNFYTNKVRSMHGMVSNCSNLTTIPLYNTSNVREIGYMVAGCTNITTVPNFDTGNVINMYYMFQNCSNLIEVPNFNTSSVINMYQMFMNCNNLPTIPNFNTALVVCMSNMFMSCNNLVTVPQLDTSNVVDMSQMFNGCNNLSNASIQNIVNMVLNSSIKESYYMNLSNANRYSPLNNTKFNNSYYSNRLSELSNAGWTY